MPKRNGPKDPLKETRILTAAVAIFARAGYQAAKTDEIAARAEVSKGLVFNYFGSKAQLYVAAVQSAYDNLIERADMSVWQDAPDLKSMVVRATKYKIQMQLAYPDEFALAMAAYADVGNLPQNIRAQVTAIWNEKLTTVMPDMITPVLQRTKLRPGVRIETVQKLMSAMVLLIGEESKALIKANPNITIGEMSGVIAEVEDYMDIMENGFVAKSAVSGE
jgi:AcrR family transcriptional regulator